MNLREKIIHACLDECGVCLADVLSQRRVPKICACRSAIAFNLHEHGGISYPEISVLMGRKFHGACIAAARRYPQLDAELLGRIKARIARDLNLLLYRPNPESRMRLAVQLREFAHNFGLSNGSAEQYAKLILERESKRLMESAA